MLKLKTELLSMSSKVTSIRRQNLDRDDNIMFLYFLRIGDNLTIGDHGVLFGSNLGNVSWLLVLWRVCDERDAQKSNAQ